LSFRSEEELANELAKIERVKIGALFYRTVSLKSKAVDSVVASTKYGGRFNPPLQLASSLCNLPSGFGLLYTATNPITCLFECGHILRGSGNNTAEFQPVPVQPTLLVCFKVEADRVLDLRSETNQQLLGETNSSLSAIDHRAVANARGSLTQLQTLGVAAMKSNRFTGVLINAQPILRPDPQLLLQLYSANRPL
jgi:hypothetical protein